MALRRGRGNGAFERKAVSDNGRPVERSGRLRMWVYEQESDELSRAQSPSDLPTLAGTGYSGRGPGRNSPDFQCLQDVGPIPRGYYDIRNPVDHPTPYSLPLKANPETDLCGRSGFFIHGDRETEPPYNPGIASEGRIILSRAVREAVWASGDRLLQVVRG